LNEDRPTVSATKMQADDSSFWQYTVYTDNRLGSLDRRRQTTTGCRQQQFSAFPLAVSLETLEVRPALSHKHTESLVGFPLIPKHVTLNGLEWLFYVKFYFYAGMCSLGYCDFLNLKHGAIIDMSLEP